MSDQTTREAAARAWWKDPSHGTAQALAEATRAVYGYACPQEGTLGTMLGALSLWMKWCREDAAKAAPAREADALEGVVWEDAAKVVAWGDAVASWCRGLLEIGKRSDAWHDIEYRDMARIRDADGLIGGSGHDAAIAHARAQLAREAHKAAPVQPAALTLEQARAMLEAAGATVTMPKVGGFERPDLALAALRLWREMTVGDREALGRTLDVGDVIKAIDGLRAFGVTPAVLS